MKRLIVLLVMLSFLSTNVFALQQDSMKVQPKTGSERPYNPVYYGGTVGLSFGNYFRINVAPMVGFRCSPKASVGVKVAYEYIRDNRYEPTLTASNYGGSFFARYRLHPKLYAHAEFAYMSYKYKISNVETDRTWVPFFFLGGGFIQPISPKTSLIVEVLFDLLQDKNSPYEEWEPFISIGLGVGF
jgi:hypothetical protein